MSTSRTSPHSPLGYLCAATIVVLSLLSPVANAQTIEDQNSGGPSGFTTTRCMCPTSILDIAQTFTVGQDGTLAEVEVFQVFQNSNTDLNGNPLLFDIRPTTIAGLPVADDSLALATVSMPANMVPAGAFSGSMVFDVSSFDLTVNAGDVLAFVLRRNGNTFSFATSDAGDVYAGGLYTQRFFPGDDFPDFTAPSFPDGTDMSFRTSLSVGIEVTIDIKPGSFPNSINLGSGGVTPVAILGSASLDVNDIDTDTLRLGTAGVKTVGKTDRTLCSVQDVSGDFSFDLQGLPDGFDDLVCHFVTMEIVPEAGDTEAKLAGNLLAEAGGTPIEGTDTVNIVP